MPCYYAARHYVDRLFAAAYFAMPRPPPLYELPHYAAPLFCCRYAARERHAALRLFAPHADATPGAIADDAYATLAAAITPPRAQRMVTIARRRCCSKGGMRAQRRARRYARADMSGVCLRDMRDAVDGAAMLRCWRQFLFTRYACRCC